MKKIIFSVAVLALIVSGCKKEESLKNQTPTISTENTNKVQFIRFGDFGYTYDDLGNLTSTRFVEGNTNFLFEWKYVNDSLQVSSDLKGSWKYPLNSQKFHKLGTYDVSGVLTHIEDRGWEIFNTVLNGDVVKIKDIEDKKIISYSKIYYSNVQNKEKLPIVEYGGLAIEFNPFLYGEPSFHLPERLDVMDSSYSNILYSKKFSYIRNPEGFISKIIINKPNKIDTIFVEYKK